VGKEVDSSSDNDGQPDAEDDNENREELEVIIIVDIEIDDNRVENEALTNKDTNFQAAAVDADNT